MKIVYGLFFTLLFIHSVNCNNLSYYTLPDLHWAMGVDISGFSIIEQRFNDVADSRYINIVNDQSGVSGMINIEPSTNLNVRKLSDMYSKEISNQYQRRVTSLKRGAIDNKFVLWYTIKMDNSTSLDNLVAFITKDEYQIIIYFSTLADNPDFQTITEKVVTSVSITNDQLPTISDLYEFGKYHFLNQNFFKAIEYFSMAYQIDGVERSLNYSDYVDFITLTSYSYSVTGSKNVAVDVLKKGLEFYPEEPLFYYNLAVIMVFYGFNQEVFEYIELAFIYAAKQNRINELPDPLDDPAFQSFVIIQANRDKISRILLNAKEIL